jgi:SAM-dependent methyltransferase
MDDQSFQLSARKMIEINVEQAKFYDSISAEDDKKESTGYAKHKMANFLTRVWASLRYRQQAAFVATGLQARKEEFLQYWIDQKRGGDTLELGCFRGTGNSWPLIEASGNYLGIDLSANATEFLNRSIVSAGLSHKAKALPIDFLVMETTQKFDLIFAHAVLHHFEKPEPLFSKISTLLKPDGILLMTEPSQVNPVYNLIRKIYRPFQSDSAWEWPFTKKTVATLESRLSPLDGFGWGRISLPLSIFTGLPIVCLVTQPLYVWMVKREVAANWSKRVWQNSIVCAAYKKNSANS